MLKMFKFGDPEHVVGYSNGAFVFILFDADFNETGRSSMKFCSMDIFLEDYHEHMSEQDILLACQKSGWQDGWLLEPVDRQDFQWSLHEIENVVKKNPIEIMKVSMRRVVNIPKNTDDLNKYLDDFVKGRVWDQEVFVPNYAGVVSDGKGHVINYVMRDYMSDISMWLDNEQNEAIRPEWRHEDGWYHGNDMFRVILDHPTFFTPMERRDAVEFFEMESHPQTCNTF